MGCVVPNGANSSLVRVGPLLEERREVKLHLIPVLFLFGPPDSHGEVSSERDPTVVPPYVMYVYALFT